MMRTARNQAALIILLFLTLVVVFLILPTNKAASAYQAAATGTSTPAATLETNPVSSTTLYAFVNAPDGIVTDPYIVLNAYANLPASVVIQVEGTINANLQFTCPSTPCKLPLTVDSVVRFHAFTDQGNTSQEITVTVRVQKPAAGQYKIKLEYDAPNAHYADSCASIWNVYSNQYPAWAQMPASPAGLNTDETLYFLAANLITSGIVDASSCASGGLDNKNSPNGCGMEKARPVLRDWQNQFDLDIWLSSGAVGIPPELLKTLLMRESQFWPGNSRYYLNEFGLAQINDYGADVILRWDPTIYNQVCTGLLADCSTPYGRVSSSAQAMLRGALISQVNSDCPGCKYGLNVEVAHTSIYVIARLVHANCWETRYILDQNHVDLRNYEDLWKLTMASYHSGFYCLNSAVKAAVDDKVPVDWSSVSSRMYCAGAREYVDDFWNTLNSFNNKVYIPTEYSSPSMKNLPTATPGPTATRAFSKVRVRIQVFTDANNDGIRQPSEGINGVSITLTFADNTTMTGTTDQQGEANFDLTGHQTGEVVAVSLPKLFRRQNIVLPEAGIVDVQFVLSQPQLPTAKP